MSSRAHRRRTKPPVNVRQAFEDNENENKSNTQDISDEHQSWSNGNIDSDRFCERAFFTINDSTVEVILKSDVLSWSNLSDVSRNWHKKTINDERSLNSINLRDVYAVSPIYNGCHWLLNSNQNESNTMTSSISTNQHLRGFQLHTYEATHDNILQEILIIFQSNFPRQMEDWYTSLSKIVSHHRPSQNVLVLCNPYSGASHSRFVYNTKVKPMLERAQYNITYSEISDEYSADKVFDDFQGDFDLLYGLVIIGGDGSVINAINALLRYLAKQNRTRLDTEYDLPSIPFPLCIVPNGKTNIICHSIHGCVDHCTSMLHLLYNQRMKIDMSAIFDVHNNFITANFSAAAGYPAAALKYFPRYSYFTPKKTIRKAFAKAASNKNLK